MTKNWDWTAADASFKRALALEPRNVRALRSAAALAGAVGRFDEAIALGQRAAELEPTNAQIYYNLVLLQRKRGHSDGALLSGRRSLELDPKLHYATSSSVRCTCSKATSRMRCREFDQEPTRPRDARTGDGALLGGQIAESTSIWKPHRDHRDDSAREIAQVYAWRNESDKAFEWLDRAYAQRDMGLAELKGEPLFRNLEAGTRGGRRS